MLKKILKDNLPFNNKSKKKTSTTNASENEGNIKDKNKPYPSNPFARKLYRQVSRQTLDLAVKPQLVGELPDLSGSNALTFYVLQEYSRSNSILIDSQTKEHNLPPALARVTDELRQVDESAGIIFLHHPSADKKSAITKKQKNSISPRLQRLINAVRLNPEIKVQLVPVTILWGRAPEKEDSLFKLLVADNWKEPTISKQLFNIGVMGRDTFVEFHQPHDMGELIAEAQGLVEDFIKDEPVNSTALITAKDASLSMAMRIQDKLHVQLDKRRSSILGPDLSDKRNIIDKLLYTPAIKSAIQTQSEASGQSVEQTRAVARGYLNEIVTDYSYPVVRFFDYFLTWLWTKLYDGVEVMNFEHVREISDDHEIIYVPCHRSHIDYLLLSFIIYKQGLGIPYIAAGDNLNMPVVGKMLRSGGAFFMRRSFRDNPLYGAVFKEYMHSIIERNTPIEYFIEGGRSRSGRLLPPKMGMLSMTVQSHLRKAGKPIAFIPTYIGYERIVEGGTYIGELKGKPKESESLIGLMKAGKNLERVFGTVHVNFGTPLYLKDFMDKFDVEPDSLPLDTTDIELEQNTQDMISNIGIKILQNINKAAVLNPVSLLSFVLLSASKYAVDENSCIEQIALYQRIAKNSPYDNDMTVTQMSPSEIIDYGIKLKLIERRPHLLGNMVQVANNQAPLLSYFRNNILHVFILLSFLSALVSRNGRISKHRLGSLSEQVYPFLQTELFLKYPHRNIVDTIHQKLDVLITEGLVVQGDDDYIGIPEANSKAYQQLKLFSAPIMQSLERYIMTLTLLAGQGSGKLTIEQVVDLCHLLGQRLSVLYADDIPDTFDRALFKGFVETLIRLGYIDKEQQTGILSFGNRIEEIAEQAKYILTPDMMSTLENIADLDDSEIEHVVNELNAKKQRKKRRKKQRNN